MEWLAGALMVRIPFSTFTSRVSLAAPGISAVRTSPSSVSIMLTAGRMYFSFDLVSSRVWTSLSSFLSVKLFAAMTRTSFLVTLLFCCLGKFDFNLFRLGMLRLGQGDQHDAVLALGADLVGIDLDRQLQGAGEPAGAQFRTVHDLPFTFGERLPFTAYGNGVAQDRKVNFIRCNTGNEGLDKDMPLVFAEVYLR